MLLNVVVGAAVFALLALIAAIVTGGVAFGWAAIALSALGLLVLAIHELVQRGRAGTESAIFADDTEEVVQPDIWPPSELDDAPGESDSAAQADGDPLRPDIWP
jgi:hypothetical protein